MTKAEIAENVYKQLEGMTKREAAELVDSVFALVKETLSKGLEVKISGFGKFAVRQKSPRTGRNPQTGRPLLIEARKVIAFKPSQVLRDSLNN